MISPEGQAIMDGRIKVPEGHHYLSDYLLSPESRALLEKASRESDLEVHKRYEEEQKEDQKRNAKYTTELKALYGFPSSSPATPEDIKYNSELEALLQKYGFSSYSPVTLEDMQKYDRDHQGK